MAFDDVKVKATAKKVSAKHTKYIQRFFQVFLNERNISLRVRKPIQWH